MAGLGWQELVLVLYLVFWGGIIYFGYRAVRWFMRRERQDRAIDEAELVERVKREVLAELRTSRAAETSPAARPHDGEPS
jgi:hypothetical protein